MMESSSSPKPFITRLEREDIELMAHLVTLLTNNAEYRPRGLSLSKQDIKWFLAVVCELGLTSEEKVVGGGGDIEQGR